MRQPHLDGIREQHDRPVLHHAVASRAVPQQVPATRRWNMCTGPFNALKLSVYKTSDSCVLDGTIALLQAADAERCDASSCSAYG